MDSEACSGSGTPTSGNCADCGAPLVQYPDAEVGRRGRRCVDEVIDAQLHHQPVWISKNPPDHIDEQVSAWNRTIDTAVDDGQTNSRSKSLDRTFCVRTSASPSPRRVIRHKTPPPFQLHKASSSSTAASPAAPRWDGISVWIPNTDLCRGKTKTASECDPHTSATSSLKKTSSFRSRGARSDNVEAPSPGFSRRLGPATAVAAEEERRVSSSCDSCVTQGHLQTPADRKIGFSIFGRDAPELQRTMESSTTGRDQVERQSSSESNNFGRILQSPDGSLGRRPSTRRSDESGTPPKRLDSIPSPPPPPVSSSIRSEQLDRFLGNAPPSRRKITQSSTLNRPPSQKGTTPSHGSQSSRLSDLRRFPSSDVHRTFVEGKPLSGAAAATTASYSTVSGFVGSLPRRVVSVASAEEEAFSPEDVLNWKLSLMDSDAVRLSPGSDDCDDSSGGACSSPTRAVGSIASGGPSESTTTGFSFEETLEEVLEEGRRPTDDDNEDDDEADEGSSFDEKDPLTRDESSMTDSERRNLESSLDVFERHLDRLLSQTLDSVDPVSALMTSLELYRDRMIGRRTSKEKPTAHRSKSPGGVDTRRQFLSLTAGVECIHSSNNKLPTEDSCPVTNSPAGPYVEDQLNSAATDNRHALAKHGRESKANAEKGFLSEEQRESILTREQRQCVRSDRCSRENPSGGTNTAFHHKHLNGANISSDAMDLTSELEFPKQDKKNYANRKTTSERDDGSFNLREFPSENERDLVPQPSLQSFVPRAKLSAAKLSELETRHASKAIQIADQQNQSKRENERTEGLPGISSLSSAQANDLYPVQRVPMDAYASCPTRGRSKPSFDCRSVEGVQTTVDDSDDLDDGGCGGFIPYTRPEGPEAFIAQDYGDSGGYFSWSVPRRTGGVRTPDTASHGRSVPAGLDRRGFACFDDGRTACLDPSGAGSCDRGQAQPDANRPTRRGHYAGCSIPLPSSAADAIRSGDDVDDDGSGGGWGSCVPSAIRTNDQNRSAAASAADVAANGTMPKSIVVDKGIDLLTYRRRAPEGSGRRTNGGDEEKASSGNKIAFDEVSRRVPSDADNETLLLLHRRQQNADLTKQQPPVSTSAAVDDGRQVPSKCQHSNHIGSCNRVSYEMPPKMVVVTEGGKSVECGGEETPGRITQRPRVLWAGTADQSDGVRSYDAPSSATPYITTNRNHRPVNG